MKSKTLVLGVGNTLRRDDGIGPKVIERLRVDANVRCSNSALNYEIIDGGVDGLSLIDIIQQYSHAIIIDAVDMGLPLASIRVFTPESAIINIKSDTLSTHGFGLAEVIKLLPELGITTQLTIIGVQPADVSFGEGLTAGVAAKVDMIVALVNEEIISICKR